MCKMHGSLLFPNFLYSILFYSVQFYEHIKDTNKDLISKSFPNILYKWAEIPIKLLYNDFLRCNEQLAGCYTHLRKMPHLISVFRTVHHWSTFRAKEMQSTYSKTTFQSTFQYYPSINGCDFQKVSCLQNCNINFKCHMPPKICHRAGNS